MSVLTGRAARGKTSAVRDHPPEGGKLATEIGAADNIVIVARPSEGPGEYFIHSVENIGYTDLLFTTVEFLKGANQPIPIPESIRLQRAA